jgi:hypothetical protein
VAFTFPTNKPGNHSGSSNVIDRRWGYWHSSSGIVSYDEPVNRNFTEWESRKWGSSGDRFRCTDYQRDAGRVLVNKPWHIQDKGTDSNGPFEGNAIEHFSRWNPMPSFDPPGWNPIAQNAISQSVTEARNKLREGKVQNGAGIAEARQSANLISDSSIKLLSAYKAFKNGNWGLILKNLGMNRKDMLSGKFLADQWLAYQYGWAPLYGSIYDNVILLNTQLRDNSALFTVQKSVKDKESFTYYSGFDEDVWQCKIKARTGFTVRVSDSVTANLDIAGVVNPLEVIWELTPLSFVVDWFVPIGNILESLSATLGLEYVTGYTSYVNERTRTLKRLPSPHAWDSKLIDGGEYTAEWFNFRRTTYPSFPMPELYGKRNPFRTSNVLSALALIRNAALW